MLISAIILMNFALLFYTIGVWSEKKQGALKKWHLYMFWIGLFFDTTGTTIMGKMANRGFTLNFHGLTGLLAIALMLLHALWATYVLIKNNESSKIKFHKFSILVWCVWLIPFISGVMIGMIK